MGGAGQGVAASGDVLSNTGARYAYPAPDSMWPMHGRPSCGTSLRSGAPPAVWPRLRAACGPNDPFERRTDSLTDRYLVHQRANSWADLVASVSVAMPGLGKGTTRARQPWRRYQTRRLQQGTENRRQGNIAAVLLGALATTVVRLAYCWPEVEDMPAARRTPTHSLVEAFS
jgi:hypothetical protein